ncbi:hypothetical protein LMG28727_02928 [Paraburkholderia kirstenboschensis]|uniref:DUF4435 domain-containing protein n=1 Tax=Paraburkholderia kirstenboschensis TaxID=1245436 RepID=UPI000A628842|nr:DUF4435 domain-containing protein [Paraburkholderia kirstenboschensis]CAD6532372.1 hypothetical protein LMG28727_02928 [Paraburkholderia kirstenboschensis]
MNDFPERGATAKFAASVFYEDFNDIDVYVEDKAIGFAKVYSTLLSRLLADKLTISKVFPQGGRDAVVAKAKEFQAPDRRSIYIVDGDLYLICGEMIELPSNVLRLDRYCIENYLCDELAICEIMDEEHLTMTCDDFRAQVDFEGWRANSSRSFRSLFLIYAASHYLDSGIATTSRKFNDFISSKYADLDDAKVQAVCYGIKSALDAQYGADVVDSLVQEFEEVIDEAGCFITKYVSAKEYTLPMMLVRMRAHASIHCTNTALYNRLAKKCRLDALLKLKQEILNRVFPPATDRLIA